MNSGVNITVLISFVLVNSVNFNFPDSRFLLGDLYFYCITITHLSALFKMKWKLYRNETYTKGSVSRGRSCDTTTHPRTLIKPSRLQIAAYQLTRTAICPPDSPYFWEFFCACKSSGPKIAEIISHRVNYSLRWVHCGSSSEPSGRFGRRVPRMCAVCHIGGATLPKPRQLAKSLSCRDWERCTRWQQNIRALKLGDAWRQLTKSQSHCCHTGCECNTRRAADRAPIDKTADGKANTTVCVDNLPCDTWLPLQSVHFFLFFFQHFQHTFPKNKPPEKVKILMTISFRPAQHQQDNKTNPSDTHLTNILNFTFFLRNMVNVISHTCVSYTHNQRSLSLWPARKNDFDTPELNRQTVVNKQVTLVKSCCCSNINDNDK